MIVDRSYMNFSRFYIRALWNKGGLGFLAPSLGGRLSPNLNEQQRERLLTLLEEDELWKKHEIQHLINNVDLEKEWMNNPEDFESSNKYILFGEIKVTGKPVLMCQRNACITVDMETVADPGQGMLLTPEQNNNPYTHE